MTEPSAEWKLTLAWWRHRPDLVKMLRYEAPVDFDALRDQLYRDGQSFDEAEVTLRRMFFPVPPPAVERAPEVSGDYRMTFQTSRNIGLPPSNSASPPQRSRAR